MLGKCIAVLWVLGISDSSKFTIDVRDILSEDLMPSAILMLENLDSGVTTVNNSYVEPQQEGRESVPEGSFDEAMKTMSFHRGMMNQYLCRTYVAEQVVSAMSTMKVKRRMGHVTPGQDGDTLQRKGKNILMNDEGSENYKDWLSKSTTLEDIYRHYNQESEDRNDKVAENDDGKNEDFDEDAALSDYSSQKGNSKVPMNHRGEEIYYSGGGGGYPYPVSYAGGHSYYSSGGGYGGHSGHSSGGYSVHEPSVEHVYEEEPEHIHVTSYHGPPKYHGHYETKSYEKEKDLSQFFEIALTALAFLAFKIFIVHVIMYIASLTSTNTTPSVMMPMSMSPTATGMGSTTTPTNTGTGTGGGDTTTPTSTGTGTGGGDTTTPTSTGTGTGGESTTTGGGNTGTGTGGGNTGTGTGGGNTGTGTGGGNTGTGGGNTGTGGGNTGTGGGNTGTGGGNTGTGGGNTGTGTGGGNTGTGGGSTSTGGGSTSTGGGGTSTGGGMTSTGGGTTGTGGGTTGTGAGATGTGTGGGSIGTGNGNTGGASPGTGTGTGTGTGDGTTGTGDGTTGADGTRFTGGNGKDTLKFRFKRDALAEPDVGVRELNELARRVLVSIEGTLVASQDEGVCLRKSLCEINKWSRSLDTRNKIVIPIWSLGMSWLAGKLVKSVPTSTSMLDTLKASVLGLGKADCELVYQSCDYRKERSKRRRKRRKRHV